MTNEKIEIPESLKNYWGKAAIKASVDALAVNLDGTNMPELKWSEARQYNRALLMTAQVRADFIEMLYIIWEQTFGAAGVRDKLKGNCFNSAKHSPSKIWEDPWIKNTFYRNGRPDDEKENDTLGVEISDSALSLFVSRYENEDDVDAKATTEASKIEGWKKHECEDYEDYVVISEPVPLKDFIADPDGALTTLRGLAEKMVEALV